MNLWCIGRNYAEHAKEMGHQPQKNKPLIFAKSADAIAHRNQEDSSEDNPIVLPNLGEIHFETEIVLRLDQHLLPSDWTIGLDLTARQVQAELKTQGHPWELAKTFKNSAIVGAWIDAKNFSIEDIHFSLHRGSAQLQTGSYSEMIFKPLEIIGYLKEYFPVRPGDLLFTGTPSGVGPILKNDTLLVSAGVGHTQVLSQQFRFD